MGRRKLTEAEKLEARAKRESQEAPKLPKIQESPYIRMVRNPARYPAPHECQVHINEVRNYQFGGWTKEKTI